MSKYSRRAEKEKRDRLREEWEATQEQKENEAIDIEDLKQQEDMKQGNYLESRMFDIDPKKHKAQQKQGKIRTIAEQGATEGERAAGQGKLKDQTQLPPILESREMDEIYAKDKEENKEFDEAVARGDLKEGVKIRQAGKLLRDSWEDTKAFKHWSNLPHNLGAVGARGVESFFTIDADNPKEVALELIQKVGNPRKGLAGEIIGEIPGVKVAIRQIKKEAFDFAKRIMPNGYQAKYAMAGGGEIVEEAAEQTAKANPLQMTGSGGGIFKGFGQNFVPPNPSEVSNVTKKLLNENVLVGPKRTFDYNAFRALFTGNKRGRLLEQWMQTTPHFKIPNWKTHRQELVDVFESIYGDVMQLKGIPRSQIQIDHLVTLRSTMPIYDGVEFGSPLWNKIQETFLRSPNRYNPGNTLANLDALDPGSHIVKSNFFNKRLGKDGELFFTPQKLDYMKKSDANRMEVLKDFIKIQDEGTLILREAQNVWETLYKIDGAEMPQSILNKLSKIPIGEFSHPELRNLDQLRAIITDIVESGAKKGRPKKIQNTLKRLYPDVNPDTGDIQGNLFDKK